MANTSRGLSRFKTILGDLQLENHLLFENKVNSCKIPTIDWRKVDSCLQIKIIESCRFLQQALDASVELRII